MKHRVWDPGTPTVGLLARTVVILGALTGPPAGLLLWTPHRAGTETFYSTAASLAVTLMIADIVALGVLGRTLLASTAGMLRFLVSVTMLLSLLAPIVVMFGSLLALTRCHDVNGLMYCGNPKAVHSAFSGLAIATTLTVIQLVDSVLVRHADRRGRARRPGSARTTSTVGDSPSTSIDPDPEPSST